MGPWKSLEAIRRANVLTRDYWFEPEELKAWYTTIYPDVYGGRYFVTSEKAGREEPRGWSIQYATNGGRVQCYGEISEYTSFDAAVEAIWALLAEKEKVS